MSSLDSDGWTPVDQEKWIRDTILCDDSESSDEGAPYQVPVSSSASKQPLLVPKPQKVSAPSRQSVLSISHDISSATIIPSQLPKTAAASDKSSVIKNSSESVFAVAKRTFEKPQVSAKSKSPPKSKAKSTTASVSASAATNPASSRSIVMSMPKSAAASKQTTSAMAARSTLSLAAMDIAFIESEVGKRPHDDVSTAKAQMESGGCLPKVYHSWRSSAPLFYQRQVDPYSEHRKWLIEDRAERRLLEQREAKRKALQFGASDFALSSRQRKPKAGFSEAEKREIARKLRANMNARRMGVAIESESDSDSEEDDSGDVNAANSLIAKLGILPFTLANTDTESDTDSDDTSDESSDSSSSSETHRRRARLRQIARKKAANRIVKRSTRLMDADSDSGNEGDSDSSESSVADSRRRKVSKLKITTAVSSSKVSSSSSVSVSSESIDSESTESQSTEDESEEKEESSSNESISESESSDEQKYPAETQTHSAVSSKAQLQGLFQMAHSSPPKPKTAAFATFDALSTAASARIGAKLPVSSLRPAYDPSMFSSLMTSSASAFPASMPSVTRSGFVDPLAAMFSTTAPTPPRAKASRFSSKAATSTRRTDARVGRRTRRYDDDELLRTSIFPRRKPDAFADDKLFASSDSKDELKEGTRLARLAAAMKVDRQTEVPRVRTAQRTMLPLVGRHLEVRTMPPPLFAAEFSQTLDSVRIKGFMRRAEGRGMSYFDFMKETLGGAPTGRRLSRRY